MSNSMHDAKRKRGYDEEERWAHEQDQERIRKLREKREAEEAAAAEDDDDPEDKLHYRYYGADSEPDAD